MKHLRYFRYVDAVVRAGSIRRAAEALYVTPSALDRRIHDLEAELGAPLFERHARGMRLTAAGEIFLGYVRRHLADMERVQSEIEGLKALRRGHVDLVASQALALDFLPRNITAFRAHYPGVTFSARIGDHTEAERALLAYETDLALMIQPRDHPDVVPLVVVEQSVMAMMDPSHPLAARESLRLGECMDYPLVLPDVSLSTRGLIDRILGRRQAQARIAAETNSFELMRSLIYGSRSIGFQVAIGAPRGGLPGQLVSRPIEARDVTTAPVVCAQLRGRHLSVAAARFADRLTRELDALRS